MTALQPLDIVVFSGQSKLLHSVIEWRSLDSAVHCAIVVNSAGTLYDPDFKGIVKSNLSDYKGRQVTIHRYNGQLDTAKLITWCESKVIASKGYDYKQWLFGFVLGINTKAIADDETCWTCAELPYWMFQENYYKLTPKEEILPMPRLFRYNPCFTTIFEGEL